MSRKHSAIEIENPWIYLVISSAFVVLFAGEPDLRQAIIFWMTDGKMTP